MKEWFKAKKKQIIIAVIVAATSAAVPGLPPSITAPLVNVIYALFESAAPAIAPEAP